MKIIKIAYQFSNLQSLFYNSFFIRNNKVNKRFSVKEWILNKKEVGRKSGKKVANDSKYTGRKRRPRF